jgi:hypothetical protein
MSPSEVSSNAVANSHLQSLCAHYTHLQARAILCTSLRTLDSSHTPCHIAAAKQTPNVTYVHCIYIYSETHNCANIQYNVTFQTDIKQ